MAVTWLYATLLISICSFCRGQHDVNIWSILLFFRFSGVTENRPQSLFLRLLLVASLLILGYDATALSKHVVLGTRLLTVLRRFECIDCSRTVQLPPVQSVYLRQHNDVRLLLPTLWPDQVHPVRILGPSRDVCHMSRAFLSIWNCMGPDQWLLQLPYLHRIQ